MWTDGRDTDGSPGQMAVSRTAATCVAATRQMRERTGSERGGAFTVWRGGGRAGLRGGTKAPKETGDSGCGEEA